MKLQTKMLKRNVVVHETGEGREADQMTGKEDGPMIAGTGDAAVTHGKEGAVGVEIEEGKF